MSDDEGPNNSPIIKKRSSVRKRKIGKNTTKNFDLKNFKDKIMSDLL